MRFVLLCIALFALSLNLGLSSLKAQSIACDNTLSFDPSIHLGLPSKLDGLDYVVTALGVGAVDPVMAVVGLDGLAFCVDDDPYAANYGADLPSTGLLAPSEKTAQLIFQATEDTTLSIGDYQSRNGAWLLMIEGLGYIEGTNRSQPIAVEITSEMVASGQPIVAYAFGLSLGYDPILTLVTEDGQAVLDDNGVPYECDNAIDCASDLTNSVIALYDGEYVGQITDAMLSVPLSEKQIGETVRFQVSAKDGAVGDFVLLLHIHVGNQESVGAVATTADGAMGTALFCDDQLASDNGVSFVLPNISDGDYHATVVGLEDYTPVVGLFTADEEGRCYDGTDETLLYGASLPTTGDVPPTSSHVRVPFGGPTARLVIGDVNSLPGEFLLFLEGFSTDDKGNGAPLTVFISEGLAASNLPLNIYAIGADEQVDPILVQVDASLKPMTDAEGVVVRCEDAGIPELCWGESQSLADRSMTINGELLGMSSIDAMLSLPISPELSGGALNLQVLNANETQGPYILIIHASTN